MSLLKTNSSGTDAYLIQIQKVPDAFDIVHEKMFADLFTLTGYKLPDPYTVAKLEGKKT